MNLGSVSVRHPAYGALHAETPLRVWSLIVTIFGDAVMREGSLPDPPALPTSSLQAILGLLGVDANPMRASLSRLVAAGTLIRGKEGRNTFYRLAPAASREFSLAAGRIYGRTLPTPTGGFRLAAIHRVTDRAGARAVMSASGWRFLGPGSALRPVHAGDEGAWAVPQGAIAAVAETGPDLTAAVRDLWSIADLDRGYRRFLSLFSDTELSSHATVEDSAALRILLVHHYRRLVLKDPFLPVAVLPRDWPGGPARDLFEITRQQLAEPSEVWLRQNGFRAQT
jgi:phenylacetic acid degradation operon negative regulatory protein